MENQLKRKYGLLMAMCMVVGTIIGSGIFFRNEQIIAIAGGRMWVGIAAWGIGGLIALSFAYVVGVLSTRHEKMGGLIDYSEALVGKKYAYVFGWFMATIYYPSLTGILAWVSARFTVELLGWHTSAGINQFTSGETWAIALFYLVAIYTLNAISPKLSAILQISGTFIKVIPLILMGVVGTIVGLVNGVTLENLNFVADEAISTIGIRGNASAFFYALAATVFAYAGWDCVMNLNSEIRDSKKNLPKALVGGMLIIAAIYTMYFIGIFSAESVSVTAAPGGTREAFMTLFSPVAGTLLFVFIICSCIGTLNGLIVGGQRSFYAIATRDVGPKPKVLRQVDSETNVPNNSTTISAFMVAAWMLIIFANASNSSVFENFSFNIANLVPVAFNAMFIPIYFMVIVKQDDLGIFNRFIAPIFAVLGAAFLVFTVFYTERMTVFWFYLVFAALSSFGLLLTYGKNKTKFKNAWMWIVVLVALIPVIWIFILLFNVFLSFFNLT